MKSKLHGASQGHTCRKTIFEFPEEWGEKIFAICSKRKISKSDFFRESIYNNIKKYNQIFNIKK